MRRLSFSLLPDHLPWVRWRHVAGVWGAVAFVGWLLLLLPGFLGGS